ncbi:Dehydrogenase/reductase SDR family member, partial [Ooceraea biroi]
HLILRRISIAMDHWKGKVALVTGASVGIGAAIVRELAKNGMKVIAVARRLEKLQELVANIKGEYKADIYPLQCDVQKEEDILRVFKWANENLGGVDVLVNNAGVVYNDPIIEGSTRNYRNIMEVNVIAVAICSREFVKSIKQRNTSGHIINISRY